jgi:ribonuclease HI
VVDIAMEKEPRTRRLKVYFDGGCRPNPGKIEVAVVARGVTYYFDDMGCGTSTDAEWLALKAALTVAQRLGKADFDLIGDSAEVIAQASGASKCRSRSALDHLARFAELAAVGGPRRLVWTPRNQNLAGIALASRRSFWGGAFPGHSPGGDCVDA